MTFIVSGGALNSTHSLKLLAYAVHISFIRPKTFISLPQMLNDKIECSFTNQLVPFLLSPSWNPNYFTFLLQNFVNS